MQNVFTFFCCYRPKCVEIQGVITCKQKTNNDSLNSCKIRQKSHFHRPGNNNVSVHFILSFPENHSASVTDKFTIAMDFFCNNYNKVSYHFISVNHTVIQYVRVPNVARKNNSINGVTTWLVALDTSAVLQYYLIYLGLSCQSSRFSRRIEKYNP